MVPMAVAFEQAKRHRRNCEHDDGLDLFGLLPDDCAQFIFSFLSSARDRCACAAVCKRWLILLAHMRGCEFNPFRFARKYSLQATSEKEQEASRCLEETEANDARLAAMAVGTYARRLLGNLSVRCGSQPSLTQQRVTDFGLKIVSRSFPNLRSLALWDCFKVGSTGLASIAQCCRGLEKLDISNSPRIDDDGLVPIATNCRSLSALSIHSCPRVGNRSLLALASCSSLLESISISRCPQIGDEGLVSVVSHLPNINRIRLAHLRLSDATLEAVGRHGGNVKTLSLEGVTGLTVSGLSLVSRLESLCLNSCVAAAAVWDGGATRLPNFDLLKHITIKNCKLLRDEILVDMTGSTRKLESLRLEMCEWVTANGLLAAVGNCPRSLKSLHICRCDNVGSVGSGGGAAISFPLLESVTIKNCRGVDDGFLWKIAPACREATRIGLVGLSSVTDWGLVALVRSVRGTTGGVRMSLNGCGRITDWSLAAVAAAFGGRLEVLSVEGCRGVGDVGLTAVGEMCATGLRELDVSATGVTDAGLARLSASPEQKLEVLSLAGCDGVTDAGLGFLEVMCAGLLGLNVQHCRGVSRKAVESFRAALWWCDVLY